MRSQKKEHERFLLERFIETSGLRIEIEEDEREAPDFLVRFESRLIGVEVTELFISHDTPSKSLQAQESIAKRIVARAQHLYKESGGSPAHVSVCFGPGCDLRKLNREKTADTLATFMCSLNLATWQRFDWRPEEITSPIPYEITFINSLGVPSHEMSHWSVAQAGWAAPLKADTLQARIDEKAKRLPAYISIVSENWLLIVADRTQPSQLFNLNANLDTSSILNPFSRCYFYAHPVGHILQLGV